MRFNTALVYVLVLTIGVLSAACSAGPALSDTTRASGEADHQEVSGDTHQASSTENPDAVVVPVELGDLYVKASQTIFQAGIPYRFMVTNKGRIAHELMIMPPVHSGGRSMEALDEMALAMIHEHDLGPGVTATLDITFDRTGSLQLEAACHLPGHYENGMKQNLTVV